MDFIRLTLLRSSRLLSKRDRKVLWVISLIQAFLGLLDLLGVALIGILGALSVNGIQSKNAGNRVSGFLQTVKLDRYDFQTQVLIIGCVAVLLLLLRTFLTVYFTRRTIYYLTRKSAHITGAIASGLFAKDLTNVQKYTHQELLYSLTFGVNSIMVGIIGTAITAFADASIFLIILFGLLVADLSLGISSLILFGCAGMSIYLLQQRRAKQLGIIFSKLNVESEQKIVEALGSFREMTVHNRQQYYAKQIERIRLQIANVQSEMNFMPQVSKYVIETTLVVGTFVVAGIQFYLKDASHAVAALAIFMAAGSRIAPAVLRLQQGMVTIRTNLGAASPTLDLIEDVKLGEVAPESIEPSFDYHGFSGTIHLEKVTFHYSDEEKFSLYVDNLFIPEGSHVALVGPSGSGKTTLADLILGVILPSHGSIQISGMSPNDAITKWPGAISYVPQDVSISNSSLMENIALGYSQEEINIDWVKHAISEVDLTSLAKGMGKGNEAYLGERGSNISGGQRQRIGIARALYTRPKLIVLDEATSALDGETELLITNSLEALGGQTTLVTIAHRLSTVRNADLVVYMENGKILATGTFVEIRDQVPNFDRQANLMGLIR
jgi:ABC-type bacteriocin/lantibiotic exporter with double-glycine peptidase domain